MQVARTVVKVKALKASVEVSEETELQKVINHALKDVKLTRPAIILMHTTNKKAPQSAQKLSKHMMGLFKGGFNDTTKTALHFQFEQYSWDVGFTRPQYLGLEDIPTFVVVSPDKKVLGTTQKKVWSTMVNSLDKIGIDLQTRMTRQNQILQEMIQVANQVTFYKKKISELEAEAKKLEDPSSLKRKLDRSRRMLKRSEESVEDLKVEEQELWNPGASES